MAIRINCPACEAPNTVEEEKRGSKVRCRKCKEPFAVPAAKKKAQESVQANTKLKTKTAMTKEADPDDDDDARPVKKPTVKKGGFPILLAVGGVAILGLFVVCAGAGVGGFWWYRSSSKPDDPPQVARVDDKKDDKQEENRGGNLPKDGDGGPKAKVDPEPKTKIDDPEPKTKIDPDPMPKIDPDPPKKKKKSKFDPDPKKDPDPLPKADPLTPELQRVKQATVQVLALRPDGRTIEGSGFFVAPGVIVTNAHVLGMLDPKELSINGLEVVINSGEPNERKIGAGHTLDRSTDLAILRVNGANLPTPLVFEDVTKLAPGQKVHIAGFPFARKDRKDAVVNATDITGFKKDAAGGLTLVQVNGGMSPGSSGGPVVTPEGKVVGVALGAYKETDTHLAIPTEFITKMLNGKLGEGVFGKARQIPGKTVIFYQVPLIDPMQKIKEARIEVWTGKPEPARPYSYIQPTPLPEDSARQSQPLFLQGTIATNEVTVPASIPPGQVAWGQPVIVLKDGTTQWGVAAVMPLPATQYERKSANLVANFQNPKDRTVKLKYTLTAVVPKGGAMTLKGDADMLESMTPHPEGGLMKTAFGAMDVVADVGGQKFPIPKPLLDLVRAIPTSYGFDPFSKVKSREFRQLAPDVQKELRDDALDALFQFGTMHEATMLPLPNREVQPADTWKTTVPVFMRDKQKTSIVEMALNNTYDGILVKGNRREAIVTVTGKLRAFDPAFKQFDADVAGKFGFDVTGGYISSVELKLTSVPDAAAMDKYTLDIDLQRSAGNTKFIQFPIDPKTVPKPPDPVAKGKIIFEKRLAISSKDPFDPAQSTPKKKVHYKEFMVELQVGKTYTIELKSSSFDPFIRLGGPTGAMVAQNAGLGADAKVVYRAPAAGSYRILAISQNGKLGGFHLTVTENP